MRWRNLGFARTFAIASLLVGLILLPFGIAKQVQDHNFRTKARQTQSVSIKQVPVPGTRGATNIQFSYVVSGRLYTARQAGPDFNERLVNQTVLYNPANPAQAELASSRLTNQGMALGLAVLFLVLGALIWLIGRGWRAARQSS